MSQFKNLVGQRLVSLALDQTAEYLVITTDQGEHVFKCWGDCCSSPYIHSIEGVADVLGQEVTAAEFSGHEVPEGERCAEVTDAWFYTLKTPKGRLDIDFRLDHNGYYGGMLEPQESKPTEVGWGKNAKPVEWRTLTGDYRP